MSVYLVATGVAAYFHPVICFIGKPEALHVKGVGPNGIGTLAIGIAVSCIIEVDVVDIAVSVVVVL